MKFCNLFSGSSGNCTFVSSSTTNILIDAGVSCQKICKALIELDTKITDIDAIFITHEHIDHTKGLPTLAKKYGIPIFASSKTWEAMGSLNVPNSCKVSFEVNKGFIFGCFEVFPFAIPHDAIDPCGFNFYSEGKKITVATDMGHLTNSLLYLMEGSDILLLESNYDLETLKCSSYPYFLKQRIASDIGHLSNETASKAISYLSKKGVKQFILGHLSRENNFPELAYQTAINELQMNHIPQESITLSVAKRDSIDMVLEL